MKTRLLAEPSTLMRDAVTRAGEAIVLMVNQCAMHGLPMRDYAMHVEIGTKTAPKNGVPALYLGDASELDLSRDDVVRIAPMPYAGFRNMPKAVRESPVLKALLATQDKNPADLVITCTNRVLDTGFVGYAVEDFGLPPIPQIEVVDSETMPPHVREARLIAAQALGGIESMKHASAILHGSLPSQAMTRARQVAGSDWPEVEDTISMLLCFGTPADWGDLLARLAREKIRHGFWWLDEHGEHPAGIAFVVQNPPPAEAIACLKGGMVGEKWTAESAPNATLGKRIVPMSSTFVWYADEAFRAAEAAEKAKGS